MSDISELNKFNIDTEYINECIRSYQTSEISIVVTGEFSSGKTCLINALLNRKGFFPYGETECTPIYIDIFGGDEDRLAVLERCGRCYSVDFTSENIEHYARFSEKQNVEAIALLVQLKDYSLNKRIHLIDCPGTNTIVTEHEIINEQAVRKSDIVIYVINKLISRQSLDKIVSIYNQNEDMIFVLSHMDENGGNYYPDDIIEKYMSEARFSISNALGVSPEKLNIMPIGSIVAFSDRKMLDNLNEIIAQKIGNIDQNVLKTKTIAKIRSYIANESEKEKADISLKNNADLMEQNELDEKINVLKDKIDIINKELDSRSRILDDSASNDVRALRQKIKRLSDNYSRLMQHQIKSFEELTNEKFLSAMKKYAGEYNNEVKEAIINRLNLIAEREYKEANKELAALADEKIFPDLTFPELNVPDFSDRYNEVSSEVLRLEESIEMTNSQLLLLSDQEQMLNEQVAIEKQNTDSIKEELNKAYDSKRNLGTYKPVYNQKIIEGKRKTFGMIGRITGEIADIALLFWNPAGAAGTAAKTAETVMGAADKVKDSIKISDYLLKAVKTTQTVQKTAKEVANRTMEYLPDDPSALDKISQVFDLVSLGHWGEVLGSKVGEEFFPDKEVFVEDEEAKQQYYSEREEINQNIRLLEEMLSSREKHSDIIELQKIKSQYAEMNRRKERLELEYRIQSEQHEHKKNKSIMKDTVDYYCNKVEEYFSELEKQNSEIASEIIEQAKLLIIEAAADQVKGRLKELTDSLDDLSRNKDKLSVRIELGKKHLEELQELYQSVEEWVNQAMQ